MGMTDDELDKLALKLKELENRCRSLGQALKGLRDQIEKTRGRGASTPELADGEEAAEKARRERDRVSKELLENLLDYFSGVERGRLKGCLDRCQEARTKLLEELPGLSFRFNPNKAHFRIYAKSAYEYICFNLKLGKKEVPFSRLGKKGDPDPARQIPDKDTLEPLDKVRNEEFLEILRDCFKKLKEEDRRIVELRFWDGLSHSEIGQRLGMSEGNVRVKWFRIKAQLRKCMGGS